MKAAAFVVMGAVAIMCSNADADDSGVYNNGNTTIVRNGNSMAVVTQSGDPSKAEVHVNKEPGRTTIYRRSGSNTTIVTQSSEPADIDSLPAWMKDMLTR
jgi:hypothetical protein